MAGYAKINARTHIHKRGRRIQYGASRMSLRMCTYNTLINARDCRVCARGFVSVCARGVRACDRRCPCVVFPPILLRFRTPIGLPSPPPPLTLSSRPGRRRPCVSMSRSRSHSYTHTRANTHLVITYRSLPSPTAGDHLQRRRCS